MVEGGGGSGIWTDGADLREPYRSFLTMILVDLLSDLQDMKRPVTASRLIILET
jgi:hypothetical protein